MKAQGARVTSVRSRVEVRGLRNAVFAVMVALMLTLAAAGVVAAAQEAPEAAKPSGVGAGLMGLAAAVAVGLGAIGTAWAQSRIGAAAAGAIAERPEMGGLMLVFLALPETMVILGFLIAFFVIGKI